ncbi:glycosyltransferase family 4 protein [Metabacillus idriensis]|uniref:glycosyltransferase family 4 protein n=1 Tax=Metabacillus idriensis TaxID=324768 RepID=UPI00174A01B0|nr:MraY family glycosyltransferase [Metabacillus idriensis]
MYIYIVTFLLTLTLSVVSVPFVIKLAKRIGVVDIPNKRKVHAKAVPRLGGLAIYFAFLAGFVFISLMYDQLPLSIIIGATIIVFTGFIDDKFQIKPWQKLLGQVIAAVIVLADGLSIQYLTIPFLEQSLPVSAWIALPISFFWIIGVTNAVNLIDGLDGLASGVSIIAACSILTMALILGDVQVALLSIALIGSTIGFLFFNFHPAKIFMGDTGSLLLGFLLSVFSIIGFKQVTFVTFIIPIVILAVPLADTTIAIIRRKLNNKRIMDADKNHLHHRLLASGFSHRQAVLFIYFISSLFGVAAILLYNSNLFASTIIFIMLLLVIELLIETLELISKNYKPLINFYIKMSGTKKATTENNKNA